MLITAGHVRVPARMNNCLEFELFWHDNQMFEIRVSGSNGNFSGTTEAYVPVGALAEAADILKGFPRDSSDQRELIFGNLGTDWTDGGVKLRFYCEGLSGRSFVEAWFESRYGSLKIVESAHFSAPIEAHAVDTFVAELRRMETERSGVACLNIALPVFGLRLMNSDRR